MHGFGPRPWWVSEPSPGELSRVQVRSCHRPQICRWLHMAFRNKIGFLTTAFIVPRNPGQTCSAAYLHAPLCSRTRPHWCSFPDEHTSTSPDMARSAPSHHPSVSPGRNSATSNLSYPPFYYLRHPSSYDPICHLCTSCRLNYFVFIVCLPHWDIRSMRTGRPCSWPCGMVPSSW